MRKFFLIIATIGIFALGCSGGNMSPSLPDSDKPAAIDNLNNHALWGLWQGVIDPVAQTVELTPLRTSEFHLNALPFLEPPPLVNLTLESVVFNGDIGFS